MWKINWIKSQIHSVIINQQEIAGEGETKKELSFYQSLFWWKVQNEVNKIEDHLNTMPVLLLYYELTVSCAGNMLLQDCRL